MKICLFPFEFVPKGSKLIVYGCGEAGQQFIDQFDSLQYGQIVLVVDMAYRSINCSNHQVYPPEAIKEVQDYDYVLIAAIAESERDDIEEKLLNMEVPANKIIKQPIKIWYPSWPIQSKGTRWGHYTYAQHADDFIIQSIFESIGIKTPTFLDVGANEPFMYSNTALLYKRGSRGINVDANPNCIALLEKHRPEDNNVCIGVGPEEATLPFYMFSEISGINSFHKEKAEEFAERSNHVIKKVMNIPIVTLKTIIDTYADHVFPDYFSIDVEGFDYDILKSYDLSKNGPKVITVEVYGLYNEDGDSDKIKDLLKGYGYFPYVKMGANVTFVKEEYRDLLY